MEDPSLGNVRLTDSCSNVHVINELDIPILATGLKNLVITASSDGILVSDKESSSYIKPYVDAIDQQISMDDVSYVYEGGQNILTIYKKI